MSQIEYSATEWTNRIERGYWWAENVQQCHIDQVDFSEWYNPKSGAIVVMSLEVEIQVAINHGNNIRTYENLDIHMTLRPEKRGQLWHWYAYRRQGGKLRKAYVGHTEDITTQRIVEIAKKWSGFSFA